MGWCGGRGWAGKGLWEMCFWLIYWSRANQRGFKIALWSFTARSPHQAPLAHLVLISSPPKRKNRWNRITQRWIIDDIHNVISKKNGKTSAIYTWKRDRFCKRFSLRLCSVVISLMEKQGRQFKEKHAVHRQSNNRFLWMQNTLELW